MILTIDLPDELASRLAALFPEEERSRFALSAIAEALMSQERDTAECTDAVEEALDDLEAGRTFSWEEEQARWHQQKAALLAAEARAK